MLVPKLRFKREDGTDYPEWRGTSFGETCSGFEYGMNTAACDYDGVNKYIRITDIDDTSRRYLSENAVSPKGNMQDKYIVNPNDILFARTGASVGKAYLYKDTDGLLYYAGFLIRANVNADANAYFVFSQTLTADYWNWVKLTSTRTGQQGINAQEYKEYKFNVPCLEEQQKIADFLSTIDEVVAQSEAEVQNLEQQKKAAMQKIFSQEVRFKREDGTEYPEWEERGFGTTVLIERGGSPRPIKQYITDGEGYNWVKIGDAPEYGNYITHTSEKIKKSGLNKTRQVFKGDLILSNSMSFGKPYIMAIDGCIHDGWLLIRNNQNNYNLTFLCYLLGTDYMLKQYKSLAGGSTVNNLNKDLVSMTTVYVPCLEEQQKIADFLSAYDEAISYAKQELDKWKELKKGLLQQMFV